MIQTSGTKLQNIILPSTNKALAEVLKDLSPKDLVQLSAAKDLSSVLNSILKGAGSNEIQNQKLLELLRNNPTFKSFGDIQSTIKDLLQNLQSEKSGFSITKHLTSMLEDIQNINDKTLKTKLENSGVFLESKLKNNDSVANDFKAALLKTKAELELSTLSNKTQLLNIVDKLTLQIDYFQLSSYLSNSSALYLPYRFDALEQGTLHIKKGENENYFCDIDLELKEYGELKMRLGLFEKKYINVNITAQNKHLRELLQTNIKELKEQLSSTNLIVKEIHFLDPFSSNYTQESQELNLGFELKV